jgi:hypothetical protein
MAIIEPVAEFVYRVVVSHDLVELAGLAVYLSEAHYGVAE